MQHCVCSSCLRQRDNSRAYLWRLVILSFGSAAIVALLVLGLSGCGGVRFEPLVPRDGSPTFLELHGVSPDVAARTAAVWEPAGVHFVITADVEPAQVLPVYGGVAVRGDAIGSFTSIPFEVRLEIADDSLTLAHELGHALGLQHVKGCAVMSPAACSPTLTDADFAEFARTQF